MDFQYIHDKISFLIEENHTNPHRLSLELSFSGNYLNSILNHHKDFKMSLFLELCEKLNTTPAEFFAEDILIPHQDQIRELKFLAKSLTEHDMNELLNIAKRSAYYNQTHSAKSTDKKAGK